MSTEIANSRQYVPASNRSAYCLSVGVQPSRKLPLISARRLKAAINASGARKNTPSQKSGGRYKAQNVARRSSIPHPDPHPAPLPCRLCGGGGGGGGGWGGAFTSAHPLFPP